MIQTHSPSDARESFRLVLAASAVTLALWFIPYGELAIYPIRLFVTYVHEICHAAASIVTLGWPHEIVIYADGSGATRTNNMNLLVASAGYVGTVASGAALLLVGARRRLVRPALVLTGAILALATAWLGGNPLAWIGGLGLAAALLVLGMKAPFGVARFALTFLAIQCMLNAFGDLRYLFWLSVSGSAQTDAQNMATATYGIVPAVVWSTIWAAVALAVLVATLRYYYVTTVRHSFGPGQPF